MYKFNQDNHKNISTNNLKKEKSTAKLSIQIWYISVVLTNHIGCFRLDRHFKENDTVEENLPSNIGKLGKQLFYQVIGYTSSIDITSNFIVNIYTSAKCYIL